MGAKLEDRRQIESLLCEMEGVPGWRVKRRGTAGRHHTLFPPNDGKIICVPGTPGDWRWRKNIRSEIRRAGYDPRSLA